MERSKVRLLIRDIVSKGSSQWEGNKRVVGIDNSDSLRLYRIKKIRRPPHIHVSRPTSPPFTITTYHATITPLWYMPLSFFPCIHSSMFHICMSFLLLLGLHGSPIQPLWLRSILIGCSTRLVFSKKRPYWMVLMLVYVEMAEGLVKPLVILPATVMPLTSFILIFSWRHCPLCSCWFTLFSQPTTSPPYLRNHSHIPCHFHFSIVSPHLIRLGNTFYLWQNNVVKNSSWPLSHLV